MMNSPESVNKRDLAELLAGRPSWFDVYNHPDCAAKSKTATTAGLIANHSGNIQAPDPEEARSSGFFLESHEGRIHRTGSDPASQYSLSETRLCYAFINQTQNDPVKAQALPWLTIDYQVPLKSARRVKAGKIDLVGWQRMSEVLLFIEAKGPRCRESPIKALLEIAAYTLALYPQRERLVQDARAALGRRGLPVKGDIRIQPALLFFAGSEAAIQLLAPVPQLRDLIQRLDLVLAATGFMSLAFLIEHNAQDLQQPLVAGSTPIFNHWTPSVHSLDPDSRGYS